VSAKFRHANVRGGGVFRGSVRQFAKRPITFRDIARERRAGIDYLPRFPRQNIIYEALKHRPTYTFDDLLATPNAPVDRRV